MPPLNTQQRNRQVRKAPEDHGKCRGWGRGLTWFINICILVPFLIGPSFFLEALYQILIRLLVQIFRRTAIIITWKQRVWVFGDDSLLKESSPLNALRAQRTGYRCLQSEPVFTTCAQVLHTCPQRQRSSGPRYRKTLNTTSWGRAKIDTCSPSRSEENTQQNDLHMTHDKTNHKMIFRRLLEATEVERFTVSERET